MGDLDRVGQCLASQGWAANALVAGTIAWSADKRDVPPLCPSRHTKRTKGSGSRVEIPILAPLLAALSQEALEYLAHLTGH